MINALHLTQILKCLNRVKEKKIHLENEIIIEPSNRFWEIRKVHEATDEFDPFKWTLVFLLYLHF